jgi:hypothetical protein
MSIAWGDFVGNRKFPTIYSIHQELKHMDMSLNFLGAVLPRIPRVVYLPV